MSNTITGTMTIGGVEYDFTATPRGAGARSGGGAPARKAATGILPALPDYYRVQTVRLVRYGSKDGESAKGAWTRHFAKDADTGTFYSTFDTNLGADMKKLADGKAEVRIAYTENDRGRTFVGYPASDYVEPAAERDPTEQEEVTEQEPPSQPQVFGDDVDSQLPF